MRRTRRLFACGPLSLLAAFAFSGTPLAAGQSSSDTVTPGLEACARDSAERIQAYYDSVKDLEGRFVQSTESVGIGASLAPASSQSSGRVVLAKPGRMRWEYAAPAPSLVVSDGQNLWLYDETVGEAQRLVVTEEYLSGAALQFLMGGGVLLEQYEVRAGDCSEKQVNLVLLPRHPASYERLELRANRATGEILETVVVDLLGNRTRVAFQDVRTNVSPAKSTFVFEAPPGTRTIELNAPR